jgi:hypothetical protein
MFAIFFNCMMRKYNVSCEGQNIPSKYNDISVILLADLNNTVTIHECLGHTEAALINFVGGEKRRSRGAESARNLAAWRKLVYPFRP